jgi:hypothetical protein
MSRSTVLVMGPATESKERVSAQFRVHGQVLREYERLRVRREEG